MPGGAMICCTARAPTLTACSSAPPPPPQPKARPAGWPWRAGSRPISPPAAATKAPREQQEQPDQGTEGSKPTALGSLGALANKLLMNAASLRAVRGQTHCAFCQGSGRQACSACQGAGILAPEKVKMNQVKHAGSKLKVMLGVEDAKMHDSDWQMTNRCRRCHGTGAVPCKHCGGSGRLGPVQ